MKKDRDLLVGRILATAIVIFATIVGIILVSQYITTGTISFGTQVCLYIIISMCLLFSTIWPVIYMIRYKKLNKE